MIVSVNAIVLTNLKGTIEEQESQLEKLDCRPRQARKLIKLTPTLEEKLEQNKRSAEFLRRTLEPPARWRRPSFSL